MCDQKILERVVKYCAEECQRQSTDALGVWRMIQAYKKIKEYVDLHSWVEHPWQQGGNHYYDSDIDHVCTYPTEDLIIALGTIVEPRNNLHYRMVPALINNVPVTSVFLIDGAMESLVKYGTELTALEWYTEFERIHPFEDGNGRVGSLIYNMILQRMENPVAPPDVFGKVK